MSVLAFPGAHGRSSADGSAKGVAWPDPVEEFLSHVERLSPAAWRAVFAAWKELRGDLSYRRSLIALRKAGHQLSIDAARRGELRELANRRALIVIRVSTIVQRLIAARIARRSRSRHSCASADPLVHAAATLLVREHLDADVVRTLYRPFERAIPLAALGCRPSVGPRLAT
jgi:hypothetical protein